MRPLRRTRRRAPTSTSWQRTTRSETFNYGAPCERPIDIKKKHDAGNLVRVNQNIRVPDVRDDVLVQRKCDSSWCRRRMLAFSAAVKCRRGFPVDRFMDSSSPKCGGLGVTFQLRQNKDSAS